MDTNLIHELKSDYGFLRSWGELENNVIPIYSKKRKEAVYDRF